MYKVIGTSKVYNTYEQTLENVPTNQDPKDVIVEIDDWEIADVNPSDYPDFSDAYVSWAAWADGQELTDEELSQVNADADYVYSRVESALY